jgi:hypothetical protein
MPRGKNSEKSNSLMKKAGRPRKYQSSVEEVEQGSEHSKKAIETIENSYKQIMEMQDRILSAPAMNGGFTTLMYKVENIEKSQSQLVQKVDQIHGVLYEPDTGLYARLKKVENDCAPNEMIDEIEKDIQEIKLWKNSEEKQSEKEEVKDVEKEKILSDHETTIKDLQRSINKYNAATKWIAVSLGGGIISMIIKLIYEYVSGHVKIV